MDEGDLDDVIVVVGHPYADVEATLRAWMEIGPGPRARVRPKRAFRESTGEALPLAVIPLRYRNDVESRNAIRRGRVEDPWPHLPGRPKVGEPDE
ncbi:hypothetical protein [Spirillospora sp. NPDC047279]|uniref:hypothetical protein n=1 Tax=Spirillospora sp. NPDC047279 TaxID=3155478 RepID=UPI0033CA4243